MGLRYVIIDRASMRERMNEGEKRAKTLLRRKTSAISQPWMNAATRNMSEYTMSGHQFIRRSALMTGATLSIVSSLLE